MIDTLQIYQDLAETLDDAAARKPATALGSFYRELQQTVTKEDFRELKQAVSGLAEAQARTESALQRLAEKHTETRRQLGELAMSFGHTLAPEQPRVREEGAEYLDDSP